MTWSHCPRFDVRRTASFSTTDAVTEDEGAGVDYIDEFDDAGYSVQVGERLRAIRKQKRLSLHDVEAQSDAGVQGVGARRLRTRRAGAVAAAPRPAGAVLPGARRPAPAARRQRPGGDEDGTGIRPEAGDRHLEADAAHRGAVRDADPVPADDPGAAPGLQRSRPHDPAATTSARSRRCSTSRSIRSRCGSRRSTSCSAPPDAPTGRPHACDTAVAPFGVYIHIPFCALEVRLLRVRDLDRSAPSDRRLPRPRCAPRSGVRSPAACRSRRASSSVVARRRWSAARRWSTCVATVPVAPGAEVTVECNPDDVTVELLRDVRRRRREPGQRRRAVDVVARARLARTATRSAQRRACRRRDPARSGCPTFNLDVIYGAAGESVADWRRHGRCDRRARPAARVGVRAHDRGRAHRWPTSPTATPTTTTRPTSTSSSTTRLVGRRPRRTTRSRTGRGRATSAVTTCCTGVSRTTAGFGCAAHSHRDGPALVERPHARPLHRSRRRRVRRPRRPARRSTRRPAGSSGSSCNSGCADGVPVDALDGDELPGMVERRDDGDRWVLTRSGRLMANEISLR